MIANKNIIFSDDPIEEISLMINPNTEKKVIPNLRYSNEKNYIINNLSGKIVFEEKDNDSSSIRTIKINVEENKKYIHITKSNETYIYEIDLNTGNIYLSSYLYILQNKNHILLYDEDIKSYKNIINFLQKNKFDLVKDIFICVDGVYTNFMDLQIIDTIS